MRQVEINETEDLISAFNDLPNHYIYRGQADASWSIQSSLERVIGAQWSAQRARTFEDYSLQEFQGRFHLYDKANLTPDSKLAWLAVMQHYGVPTRLVDFTNSPYVALYFALESYQPTSQADLAVYALDYTAIMEKSLEFLKSRDSRFLETRSSLHPKQDKVFDDVVDPMSSDIVWITEPKMHNVRLDRQGGCFIVSGNRDKRIAEALELPLYTSSDFAKFTINHALYENMFALLRKMNLTSKSLYGDLDGLARSIRMQMQVYSAP